MEILQKIFKSKYAKELYNNIDIAKYREEKFEYDVDKVKDLANVYCINDNLSTEILNYASSKQDFEAAILLYESYKGITPLVAAMPEFWIYLTHVDLFEYTKKRWPLDIDSINLSEEDNDDDEGDDENIDENIKEESAKTSKEDSEENKIKKYIQDHWFKKKHTMRTTLMNLWWGVYCTIDESREYKYELTRYFFSRVDLRTRRLGTTTIFRYREAAIGILEFMIEHKDLMDIYFEGKMIYITKYFNMLGGTTQLTYMDRYFFKRELKSKIDILKTINKRSDILNNIAILKA